MQAGDIYRFNNDKCTEETNLLFSLLSKDNLRRIFDYDMCELDGEFLGFTEAYKYIADTVPKDFTIIDIGCNQAAQGAFFSDFNKYIGIDGWVPVEHMAIFDNSRNFQTTGQDFIKNELPCLIRDGIIDINKTICVCSYVPDFELTTQIVPKVFPYHLVIYPGEPTIKNLPEGLTPDQEVHNDYDDLSL